MISPSLPLSHFTFVHRFTYRFTSLVPLRLIFFDYLEVWELETPKHQKKTVPVGLGFSWFHSWLFFGYCHIRKNLYSFRHLGSFNCAAKSFWNVLLATPKNWESRTSLHICAVMDLKPNPHQKLWTYGSQDLCQPSTTGRPYHCKAVRIVFRTRHRVEIAPLPRRS